MSTTTVFHGRTARLIAQFESEFRTLPDPAAGQELKFSELTIGQNASLQDDPTINNVALMQKRDEMDSTADASGKHILCLNDFGFWLKLLLGAPVTTGAGPVYTHVYTLDLLPRPSALLEFIVGPAGGERFHRFLGMMLNELNWSVMEDDQSFTTGLIGAVEVKPFPVAAWDDEAAARWPKSRACTKRGHVYDVINASTLGDIAKASVAITNDLSGEALADNQEGFGQILLGQPMVTGSLEALYTQEASVYDAALTHTTKKLVLVSANAAGTHSLTLTVPNVEFDRPKQEVKTSKGLKVALNWRAHHVDGADPVTITLKNAVAAY